MRQVTALSSLSNIALIITKQSAVFKVGLTPSEVLERRSRALLPAMLHYLLLYDCHPHCTDVGHGLGLLPNAVLS